MFLRKEFHPPFPLCVHRLQGMMDFFGLFFFPFFPCFPTAIFPGWSYEWGGTAAPFFVGLYIGLFFLVVS